MGMQTVVQEVMVWDRTINMVCLKTEVVKRVVGTQGSVFFEAGPLYVEHNNHDEIQEAEETLDLHILGLMRSL
jgi:hypothetical protein